MSFLELRYIGQSTLNGSRAPSLSKNLITIHNLSLPLNINLDTYPKPPYNLPRVLVLTGLFYLQYLLAIHIYTQVLGPSLPPHSLSSRPKTYSITPFQSQSLLLLDRDFSFFISKSSQCLYKCLYKLFSPIFSNLLNLLHFLFFTPCISS